MEGLYQKSKSSGSKQMDEVIKGTKVRTELVLGHGQSFLFSRNRAMAQAGGPKPEKLNHALDKLKKMI